MAAPQPDMDVTERAMRQAFWNLEMAEKREQPEHVLDRMEAYTRAHPLRTRARENNTNSADTLQ